MGQDLQWHLHVRIGDRLDVGGAVIGKSHTDSMVNAIADHTCRFQVTKRFFIEFDLQGLLIRA